MEAKCRLNKALMLTVWGRMDVRQRKALVESMTDEERRALPDGIEPAEMIVRVFDPPKSPRRPRTPDQIIIGEDGREYLYNPKTGWRARLKNTKKDSAGRVLSRSFIADSPGPHCEECGVYFEPVRKGNRWCKRECQVKAYNRQPVHGPVVQVDGRPFAPTPEDKLVPWDPTKPTPMVPRAIAAKYRRRRN